jgi:hypothetical protein
MPFVEKRGEVGFVYQTMGQRFDKGFIDTIMGKKDIIPPLSRHGQLSLLCVVFGLYPGSPLRRRFRSYIVPAAPAATVK